MHILAQDVVIRDATPADADALVALLNPIIEARMFTAMDTPVSPESQRAYMDGLPARAILHVAQERDTGRILGCQDVTPFSARGHALDHVGTMGTFVHLAHLGQGVGSRLFGALYPRARELGYEKLFTHVRADNDVGLRAYLAQGFVVIGTARRHCRIDGRYIDEHMIERFL